MYFTLKHCIVHIATIISHIKSTNYLAYFTNRQSRQYRDDNIYGVSTKFLKTPSRLKTGVKAIQCHPSVTPTE